MPLPPTGWLIGSVTPHANAGYHLLPPHPAQRTFPPFPLPPPSHPPTGWFIESLLTQTLVIYCLRTQHIPLLQSPPAWPVVAATSLLMIIGLALPHTPAGAVLGMVHLPGSFYGFVVLMVVSYCLLVQVVKVAYRQIVGKWL